MKLDEVSLREEVMFWRKLRDKYQLQVSRIEHQRIQDAVDYSEQKLEQYLADNQRHFRFMYRPNQGD